MMAPKRAWIIAAFAALYLIWGSTYLGILYAIQSIPPFLMAGTRFLCAGMIMYVIARLNGEPVANRTTWKGAFIIGGCLLLGGNGAVTISEKWVPTGLAALIVATVPIDIALLGWITGTASRPTPLVWLGLIGGFIGVGILIGPALAVTSAEPSSHIGLGMLILLIGSLLWSAGSLYSRRVKHSPSLIMGASQQMICGGALLLLAGLTLREQRGFSINQVTWLSIGGFVYLVLIGAIVGYTSYFFLLRHCDPAKVATYAYVNPIVAVILGTLFAGEHLTSRTIVAAVLIIGSVAIVITAQQLRTKSVSTMVAEAN
jgi:drug/metabolite transporter (DMT)-like permease